MAARRAGFRGWGPLILILVIAILYIARSVFIPLALALTLTFLLTPAVMRLQMLGLGRTLAVAMVMTLSIAALGAIVWAIGNQVLLVINDLPQYSDNIRAKIAAIRHPAAGSLGGAAKAVEQIAKDIASPPAPPDKSRSRNDTSGQPTPVRVVEAPANTLAYARELIVPALKPLGMAAIVLICTVFMLIRREDLRNRLFRLAGMARLNVMTQALDDAAQRISRYLWMQILVNGIFGVLIGTALFFIGLPAAALWGVLAALARTIPYVGTPAAASLPLLLSMAVFNTWGPPLMVFLLFAVIEIATFNFVEPWLYGVHTGIAPLALLVTTIFWTVLWGWAGLLLSTPLTVCLIVMGRYMPRMSFIHVLLGDEETLALEAQFYQRLLAMDQQEARTIAAKVLAEKPLIKLYDEVMIPALMLAEQDRHKDRLDEERESFLFLSMKELVAELADSKAEENREPPPQGLDRYVTCIPASDQADEIVATMLAHVLDDAGVKTRTLGMGSAPERSIARLPGPYRELFCISAVPPFALAPARSLCGNLRARFPRSRIIVAFWGANGDRAQVQGRFGGDYPDAVVTSLEQALEQIIGNQPPGPVEEPVPAASAAS